MVWIRLSRENHCRNSNTPRDDVRERSVSSSSGWEKDRNDLESRILVGVARVDPACLRIVENASAIALWVSSNLIHVFLEFRGLSIAM